MGAVSRVFVEVGWRRGLGAEKPRSGIGEQRKEPGGRQRRKRGAGGRARCMRWPRRALLGCAALKSAHPSSRQTVSRRALRKEPRNDLFSCFFIVNEFEIRNELTSHAGLDPDQLVDPVVELAEQNAIELVPAPLVSSHTCKETFRRLCAEGQKEAL